MTQTNLSELRELRIKAELSCWKVLASAVEAALEPGASLSKREQMAELATLMLEGVCLDQRAVAELDLRGAQPRFD